MRKITAIIFLTLTLSSCFLFSKFKRTNFTYSEGAHSYFIPILVPKGYIKERTEVDSSGNTILSYSYSSKASYYVAYLVDTATQLQSIIEEENIPRVAMATGAFIYKGMDADMLYWREIRKDNLRVGYRSVPRELESRFDSATNYVAVRPLK